MTDVSWHYKRQQDPYQNRFVHPVLKIKIVNKCYILFWWEWTKRSTPTTHAPLQWPTSGIDVSPWCQILSKLPKLYLSCILIKTLNIKLSLFSENGWYCKPFPTMMTIAELGTTWWRVATKPKGMAEFSAHYFLVSPQDIINQELTVHFPRCWVLPLVLFNGATSFLIETITTLWLGYSEVYLQPFCQLIKSIGWKTNGCVFFLLSLYSCLSILF